ncbi:MAG TPA: helix-hairpin-helix domain-containing protein [Methanomassiliicoccales archaeon]|nr:helix-hairpin-helix domain-containing protein [Methanomassiliicoccales archaeon]
MDQDDKESVLRELRTIPVVGEKVAEPLYRLGIRSVKELVGRSPEDMYGELRTMKGFYVEPCMLNQLKVAVSMAAKMK